MRSVLTSIVVARSSRSVLAAQTPAPQQGAPQGGAGEGPNRVWNRGSLASEVKPATVRAGQPVLLIWHVEKTRTSGERLWVIPLRTFPFRPELEFVSSFVCESTVDYQRLFKKN